MARTCLVVDDSLVGRYIDAAEALGCGQAEKMIVLVNGAAYSAKCVVAVCENVGEGEFLQAAGHGSLNNADIGDVMRSDGVIAQVQLALAFFGVVALQNVVRHRLFAGLCR